MTKQITRYNAASGTLAGVTEAAEGEFVRYADIKHLLQGEPESPLTPHGEALEHLDSVYAEYEKDRSKLDAKLSEAIRAVVNRNGDA